MKYRKPDIKTLDAHQLVELIGPAAALISGVQERSELTSGSGFAPDKEFSRR